MSGSTRWLLGLLGLVGVLVVAALLLAGRAQRPAELAADSPEEVVQRYLQGVAEDDDEAIRATLHPDRLRECERHGGHHRGEERDFSATLREVERDGGRAEVTVDITHYEGEPPFGSGGWDHREAFVLLREGGAWRIHNAAWPYRGCPGGGL